jgi:hypothetical protein
VVAVDPDFGDIGAAISVLLGFAQPPLGGVTATPDAFSSNWLSLRVDSIGPR